MNDTSPASVEFRVQNLDCEHDADAIQRGLKGFPGLVGLRVYPRSAKVLLEFDPDTTDAGALRRTLEQLGFPVYEGLEAAGPPVPWRNPKVLTSVASGLLLLAGWLIGSTGVPELLSVALYVAAIVVGGYFFGREAIEELVFEREIGIELLMSIAAVIAALMGQAAEGAMLAFLYSISEAAEGYTEEKTRAAIRALMSLAPKVALVRRDGREEEIPVEELAVGDVFIIRPGQTVATDGVVIDGRSSLDQSPVTGESIPVEKLADDPVFAGTINQQGALEIRATKTFADNTISRIIQMVEEAQERKGRSQRFIERFGARYSPAVLLIGVLIAIVPPLFLGGAWLTWITRATVFIVAAAPCALVISIPLTLVATLGTAARQGVLVKGGVFVEELARVKVVAVDKTGTLTRGEPQVTDVLEYLPSTVLSAVEGTAGRSLKEGGPPTADDILMLAAAVESRSEHPLAQAIVWVASAAGAEIPTVTGFQTLPGAGAAGWVDGQAIVVGSPDLFSVPLAVDENLRQQVRRLEREGKTVILVGSSAEDERHQPIAVLGLIAIRDAIRPNARRAIDALHAAGVQKVVMLTGDNERVAQAIARELGIDTVYAGLRPEDKVFRVQELARHHGRVAMVGDGVNDAPALAEATVGVAMGAAGTDVALETADVALMADDLEKLAYALRLARRSQSVVRQNLVLSAMVISALAVGAVAGLFTLPIAVLGHEISEFVVIGSGLRMLKG
jgi:heavy metal translocating P-type ATPase